MAAASAGCLGLLGIADINCEHWFKCMRGLRPLRAKHIKLTGKTARKIASMSERIDQEGINM